MEVLKCKICGGNIKITEDSNIGICEYCGNTISISNVTDEKIMDLFEKTISSYDSNISTNKNIKKLTINNVSASNLLIYNSDDNFLDYIFNIVLNKKPEEIKLLIFTSNNDISEIYNNIEHLLIPIVKEDKMFLGALSWIYQEMQFRAKKFQEIKVNNIQEYNKISDIQLPKIVVIIDDIYKWSAYLNSKDFKEAKETILNLDRMNTNKYGVQIIGITKYDEKNIDIGELKIVFNPMNCIELKKIFNEKSIDEILDENKKLAKQYERKEENYIESKEDENNVEDDVDPLLEDAIQAIIEIGQVSVSYIQRKFEVGYARAGRIIDQMEERGVISKYQGSKPREVLITKKIWEEQKNIGNKDINVSEELRLVNNFINNNLKNKELRKKFEIERDNYYEIEKSYNRKLFKSSSNKIDLLKKKAMLFLYEEKIENIKMDDTIKEMIDIFINDTTLRKFDYIELKKLYGKIYEDSINEFFELINTYNPHNFEAKIKTYLKIYEICEHYYSKKEGLYDEYLFDSISEGIECGGISASLLQRKLEVDYERANIIINQLEYLGIISKSEGSKPRKILITEKDEELLNEILEQIEEICKK